MVSLGLEKTPSDIRIAVSRVNGLSIREWFRRAGLSTEGAAADFRRDVTGQVGMALPNPSQAKFFDLEFVGYRGSEEVEFVVNP